MVTARMRYIAFLIRDADPFVPAQRIAVERIVDTTADGADASDVAGADEAAAETDEKVFPIKRHGHPSTWIRRLAAWPELSNLAALHVEPDF